jgi:tetratricopeptide (TPR) repeat protein
VAVEKLVQDDLSASFWYAMEALNYEPMDPEVINVLAVIGRRSNYLVEAEALYQFGIKHSREKLSLLKNYYILLTSNGRMDEAKQIEEKINKIDDPSPFNWIRLAKSAYDEGDYNRAIQYYGKAVELAPYLHEGYAGLAFSYYKLGNLKKAETNLTKALEVVYRRSVRSLYRAKLAVLQKEIG